LKLTQKKNVQYGINTEKLQPDFGENFNVGTNLAARPAWK